MITRTNIIVLYCCNIGYICSEKTSQFSYFTIYNAISVLAVCPMSVGSFAAASITTV